MAKEQGWLELALEIYGEGVDADPDDVQARVQRGYLLETHAKNLKGALEDYDFAANRGDSWAQRRLGWWYMTGFGVPKDLTKAEGLLRKAAAQNDAWAREKLEALARLRAAEKPRAKSSRP